MNRVLQILSWVVSLVVLAVGMGCLAIWPICLLHAVRLRAIAGQWPSSGSLESGLPVPAVDGFVAGGLLLVLFAAWVLRRVTSARQRIVVATLMSVAALGIGCLLIWWDPFSVVGWAF